MALTLDQLKAHLNITDTNDDLLLTDILSAATSYVEGFTGSIDAMLPAPPPELYQAVKLLAAFWYENRESAAYGSTPVEAPFGFWSLVNSHRKWSF